MQRLPTVRSVSVASKWVACSYFKMKELLWVTLNDFFIFILWLSRCICFKLESCPVKQGVLLERMGCIRSDIPITCCLSFKAHDCTHDDQAWETLDQLLGCPECRRILCQIWGLCWHCAGTQNVSLDSLWLTPGGTFSFLNTEFQLFQHLICKDSTSCWRLAIVMAVGKCFGIFCCFIKDWFMLILHVSLN